MINDNTILSSFDDKPTLLEWLKKVEDALKTDTATAVSVENPEPLKYIFKITFADGKTLSSGNVIFPNSVADVSIKNGHIIVTMQSGAQEDLGVLNPYAGTIVVNAETNTTEIGGKLQVSGEAQVTGNVTMGGNLGVTGQAVIGGTITAGGKAIKAVEANPTGEATGTLSKIKIGNTAYAVGGGGTQWYSHKLTKANGAYIEFALPFEKNLFELGEIDGKRVFGAIIEIHGPSIGNIDIRATFPNFLVQSTYIQCFSLSNGNVAPTNVNYADYNEDIVTKYQVF